MFSFLVCLGALGFCLYALYEVHWKRDFRFRTVATGYLGGSMFALALWIVGRRLFHSTTYRITREGFVNNAGITSQELIPWDAIENIEIVDPASRPEFSSSFWAGPVVILTIGDLHSPSLSESRVKRIWLLATRGRNTETRKVYIPRANLDRPVAEFADLLFHYWTNRSARDVLWEVGFSTFSNTIH